jgi:hypothetical protein
MSVRRTSYGAGDEVDAKCSKCKIEGVGDVVAHTVIAMKGAKIARVKCNSCTAEHAYRAPPTASEATAAKRRAERKTTKTAPITPKTTATEFEVIAADKDLTVAEKYSIKMELNLNDIVDHPKFGIGVVTEIREHQKAHVAFPDGGRVLVYAR